MRSVVEILRAAIHVFFGVGACCRFTPCCSHYASEAFEQHGFFKGFFLATRRVLRCHPFGSSGYDPVPAKHLGSFN